MLDRELKKGSAELLILSLLEARPRHGYEISKLIEQRSAGTLRFHVASLYPLLYRLEKRGWIQGRWVEKAGQRQRRYYRLLVSGREVLASQRRGGECLWRRSIGSQEKNILDKDVPIFAVRTLDEYVGESVAKARFISRLLGIFATLALTMAVVGIYGMISYSVTQRTHEIGVRVALGAGVRDVLQFVVGQGVRLALVGIGIGLAAASSSPPPAIAHQVLLPNPSLPCMLLSC